jgi:hypothetical protein
VISCFFEGKKEENYDGGGDDYDEKSFLENQRNITLNTYVI